MRLTGYGSTTAQDLGVFALILLAGCAGGTAPTGDDVDKTISYPRGADSRVVWAEEGWYGPPPSQDLRKAAESGLPRFALYGDGSVVYRNDSWQYFRARLSEKDVQLFLQSLLAAGILGVSSRDIPPMQGIHISRPRVGIQLDQRSNLVEWTGGRDGLAELLKASPDNPSIKSLAAVVDLLWTFHVPNAEPFTP